MGCTMLYPQNIKKGNSIGKAMIKKPVGFLRYPDQTNQNEYHTWSSPISNHGDYPPYRLIAIDIPRSWYIQCIPITSPCLRCIYIVFFQNPWSQAIAKASIDMFREARVSWPQGERSAVSKPRVDLQKIMGPGDFSAENMGFNFLTIKRWLVDDCRDLLKYMCLRGPTRWGFSWIIKIHQLDIPQMMLDEHPKWFK